jgi:RNA polymerase sigma-70 factor (ECF subfamily)
VRPTVQPSGPPDGQSALIQRLNAEFREPLAFFRRRVKDLGLAEDLTQDTFVKILALSAREDLEHPSALVFRIAGNLLKDRYRMSGRRERARLEDLDLAPVSAISREFIEDQDPERVLMARERVASVVRALNELNERTRTMYVLFRLESMQQREIAELFGVSKSTVEKTILKASVHLIRRLGRHPRW